MTKKNFTAISVVLDKSGSMSSVLESTIEGFNSFIKEQRDSAVGDCIVSLHQFDSEYQTDYECLPINEVNKLDTTTFVPRGATALLDGIGKTVDTLGKRLADMTEEERPDTVIVAILTDGGENSSKDFKIELINEIIRTQTDVYNWEFVFLGANQDAIMTASHFGISSQNSMTYASNAIGTKDAFTSLSAGVSRKRRAKAAVYASGGDVNDAYVASRSLDTFTDEDRKTQKEAGA